MTIKGEEGQQGGDGAAMPSGVSKSLSRRRKAAVLSIAVIVVSLLVILAGVLTIPPPDDLTENTTPNLLQERGVEWRIVVEEPISFDEVEPLVTVFTDQVNGVFGIRTYDIVFNHVEDDGQVNYTQWWSDPYSGYQPGSRGTITIPIYFLTGFGWSYELGTVPAWAKGTKQYYSALSELVFGFTMFRSEAYGFYPSLTANRMDSLIMMLHEFAHNLGLRDLYWNNAFRILGCESLPVVMAANAGIGSTMNSHDSPPRYPGMIMNRTWHVWPGADSDGPLTASEVEEAYLFNNTLHFVSYNLVTNRTKTWMSNATEYIYDLSELRKPWTKEEASFIGMDGTFPFSCPQEF
jgi:hypothetical protein